MKQDITPAPGPLFTIQTDDGETITGEIDPHLVPPAGQVKTVRDGDLVATADGRFLRVSLSGIDGAGADQ